MGIRAIYRLKVSDEERNADGVINVLRPGELVKEPVPVAKP